MAFSTQRGRPRSARPQNDHGTPELQRKRASGITQEPIDICLGRNLISESQHWCALHLRWLYTLRYGAPAVSSSLNRLYDAPTARPDDPSWRSARENEFAEAVNMLRNYKRYLPVAQLAIFNEHPRFLHETWRNAAWKSTHMREALLREYQQVQEGLQLLESHWKTGVNSTYVSPIQQP